MQAAKQSRRSRFPEVTDQAKTADVIRRIQRAELAVLLDAQAGQSLGAIHMPVEGEVVMIVGPEGGISQEEAAGFTAAGAIGARLGPSVLRGSTAGAAAGVLVLSRCGRWA